MPLRRSRARGVGGRRRAHRSRPSRRRSCRHPEAMNSPSRNYARMGPHTAGEGLPVRLATCATAGGVDEGWVEYAARWADARRDLGLPFVEVDPWRLAFLAEGIEAGVSVERLAVELEVALTPLERFLFRGEELGYSPAELAARLGVARSTVTRARRRAMRRIVAPLRLCACGCGRILDSSARRDAVFFERRCRRRAARN